MKNENVNIYILFLFLGKFKVIQSYTMSLEMFSKWCHEIFLTNIFLNNDNEIP